MKIAILTLPLHTNIGGILQAYALQKVVRDRGHEVILLNRRRNDKRPSQSFKYKIRCLLQRVMRIYRQWRLGDVFDCRGFVEKYIDVVAATYSTEELHKSIIQECPDIIIVGSDQVWREWNQYSGFTSDFFLSFLSDKYPAKRIAYSVSFGFEECNIRHELPQCKIGAKRFEAISVREASGIRNCKEVFGVNAIQTLDPTMLLEKENYIKLIQENKTTESPGDLLCYILDSTNSIEEAINSLRTDSGLLPYDFINHWKPRKNVCQWLRGFNEAKAVLTDSFHGCVFAILFNKPFVVLGNKRRGQARFDSLLQLFGLEDRFVSVDSPDRISEILNSPIDWTSVNKKLEQWRHLSHNYLIKNLKR